MFKKVLLFSLIGLVGLMVLCTILVATSGEDDVMIVEKRDPRATEMPPLDVTVMEIFREYRSNEARANATYKNRLLNLDFTVSEIEDDHVVQILESDMFSDVEAQLRFPKAELVMFNQGDRMSRKCLLDGFVMDRTLKFDCR